MTYVLTAYPDVNSDQVAGSIPSKISVTLSSLLHRKHSTHIPYENGG